MELRKTLKSSDFSGNYAKDVRMLTDRQGVVSAFEDFDHFMMLKLRTLELAESKLGFVTNLFLFIDDAIYRYDFNAEIFNLLPDGRLQMLTILQAGYAQNQHLITGYGDELSSLEATLFERDVPPYFMEIWFRLKKDLVRIENYYYRNAIVYREFYKRNHKSFDILTDDFKDIDDSINFHNANITTLKNRMDSLHHYYDSIKTDNLNRTLLALTFISGVFLPLNLVVGFFGMNTRGMPLDQDPGGTRIVLAILLGIVIMLVAVMPLLRILDRYLLSRILGSSDFYRRIAKKITGNLPT